MSDPSSEYKKRAKKRQDEIWPGLNNSFPQIEEIASFAFKFSRIDHKADYFLNRNSLRLEFSALVSKGFRPEDAADRLMNKLRDIISDCAAQLARKIEQCGMRFKHIKEPLGYMPGDRVFFDHSKIMTAHQRLVASFGLSVSKNEFLVRDSAGQINLDTLHEEFLAICISAYDALLKARDEANLFIDDYIFKSLSGFRKFFDAARRGLSLGGGSSG